MSANKKKLVEVKISHSYIVYADDQDMIEEAKNALYEDLMSSAKYNELFTWIDVCPAPKGAKPSDIPSFLLPEIEDDDPVDPK